MYRALLEGFMEDAVRYRNTADKNQRVEKAIKEEITVFGYFESFSVAAPGSN